MEFTGQHMPVCDVIVIGLERLGHTLGDTLWTVLSLALQVMWHTDKPARRRGHVVRIFRGS